MSMLEMMKRKKRELLTPIHPLQGEDISLRFPYMVGVAMVALEGGELTAAKRIQLEDVAYSLGLPEEQLPRILETAAGAGPDILDNIRNVLDKKEQKYAFVLDLYSAGWRDGQFGTAVQEMTGIFADILNISLTEQNLLQAFAKAALSGDLEKANQVTAAVPMEIELPIHVLRYFVPGLEYQPDFILVHGGSFIMGQAGKDGQDIKPTHKVTLRKFYIGRYPVTFAEYGSYCDAIKKNKPSDAGWGRNRRPVINVTWFDAIHYCNWRSREAGLQPAYNIIGEIVGIDLLAKGFRLPTEAEWEYAAKGGEQSGGFKCSGGNQADNVAWYKDNSGGMTQPVGQKKPNELGIHDMNGNVFEWCWDWEGYYSPNEQDNPVGPGSNRNNYRILRGYAWQSCEDDMRSIKRALSRQNNYSDAVGLNTIGFRIVRTY